MENKYDFQYKLILIGDSNVGKTSLLLRFTENSFSENVSTLIDDQYKDSFNNIEIWYNDVIQNTLEKSVKFLVGNKSDLESERKVTFEEGKALADSKGMNFIETSAKNSTDVDTMFYNITKEIFPNYL